MPANTSMKTLFKRTFSEWSQDKAPRLAAAFALYTMLSLAPLLVISIKILGVALGDNAARGQVAEAAAGFVGPAAGQAIQEMITNASKPGSGVVATIISCVMLLVGATALFASMQDALNTIWDVQPKPNQGIWATIRVRLWSAVMVFFCAALLFASFVLSTVLSSITQKLPGGLAALSFIGDLIVSFLVTWTLFGMIFKVLPDVKLAWKDVALGAAITAGLFILGKYALTLYFRFGSTTSTYGAAGSLAALLIWVYYSGMIVFFGAEFTQVYFAARGKPIEPDEHAVRMTPEDRAEQGIPSPAQVAARARPPREPARRLPLPARQQAGSRREPSQADGSPWTWAVGGAAVGAAIAAMGVEYLLHNPDQPTHKQAAAVRLDQRLDHIEQRLGRVSRIKEYLDDMDVKQRVDAVERRIRQTTTSRRNAHSPRPRWMVRLGEIIAGL